jgi:hypothetical protein
MRTRSPVRHGSSRGGAEEERRHGRRVGHELAVVDPQRDRRQRAAHRARPHRLAQRRAGQLPVSVCRSRRGSTGPVRSCQAASTSGLSASPAATQPRSPWIAAGLGALDDHPVLGRRHAQHVDALAGEDRHALVGIEARVVQQRRGAADPRGDEDVARDFDQPLAAGAPDEVAGGARRAGGATCHPMAVAGSAARGAPAWARRGSRS